MERGGAEKAAEMEWPAYLNEYEKLVIRMNNPRVVIDNAVCPTATLVKVDSARKHGILLEAVQVLTDLNLSVKKAYISSDGRWFMDVFHVTDQFGRKLADDSVISYLEQSLDTEDHGLHRSCAEEGLTTLELTGADRPGLLSEVFAVLADLGCGVAESKVWTHNGRIACLVSVKDELSGSPIDADAQRIHHIESRLRHVLKCDHGVCGARTAVSSMAVAQTDRRLHQMMFADRDYERTPPSPPASTRPSVSIQNWVERGYSVVTVQCRDRPKLLFDIVCTLTDMEYVVFHGTIDTDGDLAHQVWPFSRQDSPNSKKLRSFSVYRPNLSICWINSGVLREAQRWQPRQLGSRETKGDPMLASSNREEIIRGDKIRALHGGQARAPLGGDADVPREQPVGHESRGLDEGRHGLQRVLRDRRRRAIGGSQGDRRRPAEDRPGLSYGEGGAAAAVPPQGGRCRRPGWWWWWCRWHWPVLPGKSVQEKPVQSGVDQVLFLRSTSVSVYRH